jgi:hypothetical protein
MDEIRETLERESRRYPPPTSDLRGAIEPMAKARGRNRRVRSGILGVGAFAITFLVLSQVIANHPVSTPSSSPPLVVPTDISQIQAVGSELVVLSMDGLAVTRDGGHHWSDISPPHMQISSARTFWFLDGDHGWVAWLDTRGSHRDEVTVWRTADGGTDWNSTTIALKASVTPPYGTYQAPLLSFADPKDGAILVGLGSSSSADGGGLLYSTSDGGARWGFVSKAPGSTAISDSNGGSTLWNVSGPSPGAGPSALFESTDAGKRFSMVRLPGGGEAYIGAPVFFGNHGVVLETRCCGSQGRELGYTSSDGGNTWRVAWQSGPVTNADYRFPFSVLSGNGWVVWLGPPKPGGLILSISAAGNAATRGGGELARMLGPNQGISQLAFSNANHGWALACHSSDAAGCGKGSALFRTIDGGKTWSRVS